MASSLVSNELTNDTELLGPSGGKFVSSVDSRVVLDIPPKALASSYTFGLQLQHIDLDRFRAYQKVDEKKFGFVLGFSDVLHIKNITGVNISTILHPVFLTLPLLDKFEKAEEAEDVYEVVFVRLKNKDVKSFHQPEAIGNDSFRVKIDDFSTTTDNFSAWKVRKGVASSMVIEAAKYLTGKLCLCNLVSLIRFDDEQPSLRLDCVDVANTGDIVEEYVDSGFKEITSSRSDAVTLKDNETFRIQIVNNMCLEEEVKRTISDQGIQFDESMPSSGVCFPFKTMSPPTEECVLLVVGETFQHPVNFRMDAHKSSTETEDDIFEEEENEEEEHEEFGLDVKRVLVVKVELERDGVEISPQRVSSSRMQLSRRQKQISPMFLAEDDTDDISVDVTMPVKLPSRLSEHKDYSFYILQRAKGIYEKHYMESPVYGPVHVTVKRSGVLCAIIEEDGPEQIPGTTHIQYMSVGPKGRKFVSKVDNRITVDFPKGALDKKVVFQFKSTVLDKQRYQEYAKHGVFGCLLGLTNVLFIKPDVELKRDVKMRIPLDVYDMDDDSEVKFLHWKRVGNRATVMDADLMKEADNSYSIGVSSFSGYGSGLVEKGAKKSSIQTEANFVTGQMSICSILTFHFFDRELKMHHLMFDCVDVYKIDSVKKMHFQNDDMVEIKRTRSKDFEMKTKTKINVSIEGNLKSLDKEIKANYLKFNSIARTNKVMIPVVSKDPGAISIVRYRLPKDTHHAYFSLDKLKTAPLQKQIPKKELKVSGIPVLTEKSLSALSESLPWSTWMKVGIELGLSNDSVRDISEKAEHTNSDPRFQLLCKWKNSSQKSHDELLTQLLYALQEIKRNDIAEVLQLAMVEHRELRRIDFEK
ncbi:uncharacterized protein LOC124137862 isoform X2 [Haliotis rufescens]|uniref:uncharacterized protein LOC124137862 isoform X2 n=1 Tax=Haliotis rufescens TaxID=6454 RepID=UPI00201EE1C0|nr:uncharacterized protein LOC124137862 isoform X2 [Haliotis rufescens]